MMERKKRLDEIHLQMAELKSRFESLGFKLIQQGERLKNPGYPPDQDILQEITRETHKFKLIAEKLEQAARDFSWTGFNGGVGSLAQMEEAWQGLAGHLTYVYVSEEQIREAKSLVARAMHASLPGGKTTPELEVFREKLRVYEEILSRGLDDKESSELRRQLLGGNHPLSAFLRLVEEYLDHQEAAKLFEIAAEEYGTLLAVAAARGGLVLPDEKEEVEEDEEDEETEETEVVSKSVAGELDANCPAKVKVVGGLDVSTATEVKEIKEAEGEREFVKVKEEDIEDMEDREVIEEGRKTSGIKAAEIANASLDLAIKKMDSSVQGEEEILAAYIFNLIKDSKLEPAFWLASYSEQQFGVAPLPAWLIKTLEIAQTVEVDNGPAAKWLAYLYSNYDLLGLLEKEPGEEKKLALNLLIFASLLRPTFFAPDSGAPRLLGKLTGLPRGLQNICRILVENGRESKSTYEKERQSFSREVASWQKRNQKLGLASPLAIKLWEKMQEEGNLLYQLLEPLKEGDIQKMEELRKLVVYLREESNLKNEVAGLYSRMQAVEGPVEIFHIPGSWQVLSRLREALKLAERWLKLHDKIDKETKEVDVLQEGDWGELLLPAREELELLIQKEEQSTLLSAAVTFCLGLLGSLEQILAERNMEDFTAEERAALELNRNPQLKLKPSWKPKALTVEKLGKALLELLKEGELPARETGAQNGLPLNSREAAKDYNPLKDDLQGAAYPRKKPWDGEGILSVQERDYLMTTLKNFYDKEKEKEKEKE